MWVHNPAWMKVWLVAFTWLYFTAPPCLRLQIIDIHAKSQLCAFLPEHIKCSFCAVFCTNATFSSQFKHVLSPVCCKVLILHTIMNCATTRRSINLSRAHFLREPDVKIKTSWIHKRRHRISKKEAGTISCT